MIRRRVPVILQVESAECALAALCMVAGAHGHALRLREARQQFSLSLRGATVADVLSMGARLNLHGRALRLEPREMRELRLPAILHWEMNHFVVLTRVTRRALLIHDPATGRRRVPMQEVDRKFTGIAVEMSPAPDFRPHSGQTPLSLTSVMAGVPGLTGLVGGLVLLSLVIDGLGLLVPYVFQRLVDDVLASQDTALLLAICAGMAMLVVFDSLLKAFRQWCIDTTGAYVGQRLVESLTHHLFHLPLAWFERRHVGDVLSRLDSLHAVQAAFTTTLAGLLVDGIVVLLTATALFLYDTALAWLAVGGVIIVLCLRLCLYPRQHRLQDELLGDQAKERSHLIESLRAMPGIRSVNGESARLTQWRARYARLLDSGLRLARFNVEVNGVEELVQGLVYVTLVWLAASHVLADPTAFTLGMLFAFMAYRAQFTERAARLVDHVMALRLLELHRERIADIVMQPVDPQAGPTHREIPLEGPLHLHDVGYRYAASEPWVLRHVTLTLPENRMTAIIGPSGAGKTTLMKLLLGVYVPDEGTLTVDSAPLCGDNARAWRQLAGVVLQDDQLVTGTIADNIAFLSRNLDFAAVEAAARLAGIHDEIRALPMGYLSLVGDMGTSLSAGQKQRLLIARALYARPSAIFLDEGSAHLDPNSEQHLAGVLRTLPVTRVVIAHRPALAMAADLVLEVAGGGVRDVTTEWRQAMAAASPALQFMTAAK
ncbi:MAG: peptidase domain-containing ABC transporter [Pseudomonadales bacterium]|nr:peptidase domain-containing ABC transporter [Pseudomonadales bacterium]